MENNLEIVINKPVSEVFRFVITPPNSTLWIPGIISEETSAWPIKEGTTYSLKNDNGELSKVIVELFEENKRVGWVSEDRNYHCIYILRAQGKDKTEFLYKEWVDRGQIENPFTRDTLSELKMVIEGDR